MAAKERAPTVHDDLAMRLELLAQVDVLNGYMRQLAEGVQAARTAGAIFKTLEQIMSKFEAELKRLADTVQEIKGVVPSVVTIIGELAGKFKANANDPALVTQLADDLEGVKTTLANAAAVGSKAAAEAKEPPPAPADPAPAEQPADGGGEPPPAT